MQKRVILTPKISIPYTIAEWVCANLSAPESPSYFGGALVIVPTKSAGRNLRAEILGMLAKRGLHGMAGLDILTLEAFVARLAADEKTASLPRRLAAWISALGQNPRLPALFRNGAPARANAFETAKELERLRGALSEKPMSFSDAEAFVSSQPDPNPYEAGIWKDLSALEASYLKNLEATGYKCRYDVLRQTAQTAKSPCPKIAIAAHPDAPAFLKTLVGSLAKTAEVFVLTAAGEEAQDAFDEIGRPLPDFFENLPADVSPLNASVFADVRKEAEYAARTAKAYGDKAPFILGVSCEQRKSADILKGEFSKLGVKAEVPAPRRYSSGVTGKLIASIASFGELETYSKFSGILQNPMFAAYLAQKFGVDEISLSSMCDSWREDFLPASAEALAENLASCGEPEQAEIVKCAICAVRKICGGDPDEISALFDEIFAAFDARNAGFAERDFEAEALEALKSCAAELLDMGGAAAFTAAETTAMLRDSLNAPSKDAPDMSGAVPLQNWLEIFWSRMPHLLLCDLNDGVVPLSEPDNQFITDSLKTRLGIKNSRLRRARDAYMLSALTATRGKAAQILIPQKGADGAPAAPSRILMPARDLPARIKFLFKEKTDDKIEFTAPVPIPLFARVKPPAGFAMSAYKFNSYLHSPIDFYVKYILEAREIDPDKTELDAAQFGSVFHEAMRAFALSKARDSADEGEIAAAMLSRLEYCRRKKFGDNLSAQLRVQFITMRRKIEAMARLQAERAAEGWRIWGKPERPFEIAIASMPVVGKIDRIDYNPDLQKYAIIDYKTSNIASDDGAQKSHYKKLDENGEPAWENLQLPLYALAMRGVLDAPFECSLMISPQSASETAISTWEIDDDELESAKRKMEQIIAEIRAPDFPKNKAPKYDICKNTFAMSGKNLSKLLDNGTRK